MSINLSYLIFLDRYVNEGTRTYSDQSLYTEAAEKYRHNTTRPWFHLSAYILPSNRMNLYTANPPSGIFHQYIGNETLRFFIHPQILEALPRESYVKRTLSIGTRQPSLKVSPSASTRTLYVLDTAAPHAVKVHFPFRISRYGRKMRDEVVAQAVAVSGEIETNIHRFDDCFGFMREVLGITHKDLNPGLNRGENWGYLVRDLNPFPETDENRNLIPAFSLYGKNFFYPDRPPLLFDFIGDSDPVSFVLDKIMLPVIRHWSTCFQALGFLLEPHGQNVLLETDSTGRILRIIHRDMSLGIDMRRRRDAGLPDKRLNSYNRMETGSFASITYDKFMGGHFFDRIVTCLKKRYPQLRKNDFTGPCKAEFQKIFPRHRDYLPGTVHYFTAKRDRFGKPLFKDTGALPQWRP